MSGLSPRSQGYSNDQFQSMVKRHLARGYGVEDIAVMKGIDVEYVRLEVSILRTDGDLEAIYAESRKRIQEARNAR